MKEEFISIPLNKNKEKNRFELVVDNQTSFIDYKERNQKIYLIHTEVPVQQEGKGISSALIEKTFQYIEANQYKLIALCPAVVAYIRRHPEWKRLLDLEQIDLI